MTGNHNVVAGRDVAVVMEMPEPPPRPGLISCPACGRRVAATARECRVCFHDFIAERRERELEQAELRAWQMRKANHRLWLQTWLTMAVGYTAYFGFGERGIPGLTSIMLWVVWGAFTFFGVSYYWRYQRE